MAQYEIQTPDESSMFTAAQIINLIPQTTTYSPGLVGVLTGGVFSDRTAWSANIYGTKTIPSGTFTTDPTTGSQTPNMTILDGFYGVLKLPDTYTLPGDTQTLVSRVFQFDPANQTTTTTPFIFNGVTINSVPSNTPYSIS